MAFVKPTITSWSFSRYNVYQNCPKQAYFKFILKLKEPGSPAMERGTALHKLCEDYLLKGGRIPKDVSQISATLKDLRKRKALAEANFTFRQDWTVTKWDDWNGAWCRIKADALVPPVIDSDDLVVDIKDFKTGKLKEGASEYMVQLDLYKMAGLIAYPTAKRAIASLEFIDHGKTVPSEDELLRKDLPKMQKKWILMVKPMLNDTTFKEKPGNACRWCHFRKENSGPCKF